MNPLLFILAGVLCSCKNTQLQEIDVKQLWIAFKFCSFVIDNNLNLLKILVSISFTEKQYWKTSSFAFVHKAKEEVFSFLFFLEKF